MGGLLMGLQKINVSKGREQYGIIIVCKHKIMNTGGY
jgi:hypothetical protein